MNARATKLLHIAGAVLALAAAPLAAQAQVQAPTQPDTQAQPQTQPDTPLQPQTQPQPDTQLQPQTQPQPETQLQLQPPAPPQPPEPRHEPAMPATRVELSAGLGLGTRSFERPTPNGVQVLETTPFAAADLGLRLEALRTQRLQIGGVLRYRTSLAMTVEAEPLFALTREIPARSSHFELSIVPALRLGDAHDAPHVALPVGLSARTFWTETHDAATFGYSLVGPHLRPELVWPLGPLTLRIGPELQWIVAIDRALRRDGVSDQGLSLGAEGSLALMMHRSFSLELSYRQAHALIAGQGDRADFDDTERYATLRLAGGF